jgi:hypothetical protein
MALLKHRKVPRQRERDRERGREREREKKRGLYLGMSENGVNPQL